MIENGNNETSKTNPNAQITTISCHKPDSQQYTKPKPTVYGYTNQNYRTVIGNGLQLLELYPGHLERVHGVHETLLGSAACHRIDPELVT